MAMKRCRDDGEIEAMAMANCLMLLSKVGHFDPSKHNDGVHHNNHSRVFACKTCDKRFSSFQALGGHRASHKKPRLTAVDHPESPVLPKKPKTHECSICGLEFAVGQALGGHMRRHRSALNEGMVTQRDLLSEMKKSSGGAADGGGLCLDLKLAPCGTDLDLKVAPTPVVHLFI